MATRKPKETKVQPIPKAEVKAWNLVIKETREVVARQDTSTFDLILLAGKVDAKYGEDRIGRWAEEACVGAAAARQYRWLASRGIDEAFVEQWCRTASKPTGLSYTLIREVAQFCGGLTSPYAVEYLTWATEHRVGAIGLRGYMLESTAPQEHRDATAESIKMALQDKQEHEGFSDGIKFALERILEENPEAEAEVLKTVITSVDDLEKLKIAAGIKDDDEQNIVDSARRMLNKMKLFRKWLRDNEKPLAESIKYGHELSDELKAWAKFLTDDAKKLSIIVPEKVKIEAEVVNLPIKKAAKRETIPTGSKAVKAARARRVKA